jgi:hypothetical protein
MKKRLPTPTKHDKVGFELDVQPTMLVDGDTSHGNINGRLTACADIGLSGHLFGRKQPVRWPAENAAGIFRQIRQIQKKTPPKRGFKNARNRGSCSASFGVAPHLGGAAATLNRPEYLIDVVLQIRYPFRGVTTCPFRPCRPAACRHGCAPRPSEPRRSSPLSSATDRQPTPRSATRGA